MVALSAFALLSFARCQHHRVAISCILGLLIVHPSMGLVHEHDTTIKAEYGLFRGKQVKKYGANQGQNFPSKIGMQLCTVRPFKSKIWKFYDNLIRARSSSLDSHLSVLPIFYFDNTSLPYYHILCCENLLLVIHKCVGILYSNK